MIKSRFVEVNDILIDFAWCPPGIITTNPRGTSLYRKIKKNEVVVEFTDGFWISAKPVTNLQWESVMGTAFIQNAEDTPIYGIDYIQALSFINKLNLSDAKNGDEQLTFSFPNFLEWQYACNASNTLNQLPFWSGEQEFAKYAWFKNNSRNMVHSAGLKQQNPWGIFDMFGNVLEICYDVLINNAVDRIVNPISMPDHDTITVVGGDFSSDMKDCLTSHRRFISLNNSFIEPLGIRLVIK